MMPVALTRRELFAAMAMQALDIGAMTPGKAAEFCVAYADALIEELAKPQVHEWAEARRNEDGAEHHKHYNYE